MSPSRLITTVPIALLSLSACKSSEPANADTLRAHQIEIVGNDGKVRMRMGTLSSKGPVLQFLGEDGEWVTSLMVMEVAGKDGKQREAFIFQSEAGDDGLLTLAIHPDGAGIYLGSDNTDRLLLDVTKEGVEVTMEPQHEPIVRVFREGDAPQPDLPPVPGTRGVRIVLEQGRLVVRDLDGHTLAQLGEALAPKTK